MALGVRRMDFGQLKSNTSSKILLRGESATGKTMTASKVSMEILEAGYSVKFIDLESEGRETIVKLVDRGDYEESDVEELSYVQVSKYEELESEIQSGEDFDLLVIDPMDHKHTMVLKYVTDAKTKADADWNEYPQIYSGEKQIMEKISNMGTNVLCTLDPASGKEDKPKGTQVNIHGYYSVVVDLYRSGDEWQHQVFNWIGRPDLIGGEIDNFDLYEALGEEIAERVQ